MPSRIRPLRVIAAVCALASLACATAPLPPAVADVRVYQAPLDGPPGADAMPAGCEAILRKPPQHWSELDMAVPKDPFLAEREATAAAGGNVLLVLKHLAVARQCVGGCPAAAPITDCPPCVGAWFDVVFVSYRCSGPALAKLPAEPSP